MKWLIFFISLAPVTSLKVSLAMQQNQLPKMFEGGCFMTSYGTCMKTFLADNPAVCYEQMPNRDPQSLETVLAMQKSSTAMYLFSWVMYGADCAMRGYMYDKKPHPCFPLDVYTVFFSAETQKEYRDYRQKKFDEAIAKSNNTEFVGANVTEWMLTGNCDSTELLIKALDKSRPLKKSLIQVEGNRSTSHNDPLISWTPVSEQMSADSFDRYRDANTANAIRNDGRKRQLDPNSRAAKEMNDKLSSENLESAGYEIAISQILDSAPVAYTPNSPLDAVVRSVTEGDQLKSKTAEGKNTEDKIFYDLQTLSDPISIIVGSATTAVVPDARAAGGWSDDMSTLVNDLQSRPDPISTVIGKWTAALPSSQSVSK